MKSLMPGMLLATLFCVAGCRGPYNGSWFGRVGAWREPDAAQRDEDRQIADRDGSDEDQWDSERDLNAGHAAEQAALTARQSGSTADWRQLLTEAQRNYSRVLEAPSNVYQGTAHHRLGVIADQQEDFASAEQHYVAALRLKPGDADLLSDLGYSYLSQGELTQSESYLRQALSVSPSHRQALLNLGLLRGRSGDRAGALAIFRQAGTEAEAQSMLNQLFPQGASVADNARLGAPKTRPGSAVPSGATSGTPYQPGQRNNAFAQQSAIPENRRTPAQMQQEAAIVGGGRHPAHSFSADAMRTNERGTPSQTANGWGNPHPGSFTGEPSPGGSARMNANTVAGLRSERPVIVPAGGDMQYPLTGGPSGRASVSGPTRAANGPQNNYPQDDSRRTREPIDTMQPWPPQTRVNSPQHPLVADPHLNRGKAPAVDESA
ncbi:MAG: hypothetical protein CMJ48_04855, partial [Planctomycetaceae bacterium]|nr:hypothetical protein [Planctomycetaceae bacterium]